MDISKVSLCPKSEVIILYSILKTKNHWSRYIKTCFWIKIRENLSLDWKVHKTIPSGSGCSQFSMFYLSLPLLILWWKY